MRSRSLPPWVSAGLTVLQLVALLIFEARRPLRIMTEDKTSRDRRNLIVAATAALPVLLIETPIARRLTVIAQRKRWGLLRRLGLTPALETFLAVLLLDYTMYLWHMLAHRAPVLWRFHLVHHTDREMDVTTALRFHVGEMATLDTVSRASGRRHRSIAARVLALANVIRGGRSLPPFQRARSSELGAALGALHRDAAHSRHPSRRNRAAAERELVIRTHHLGYHSRDVRERRVVGRGASDRSARVPKR